MTVFMTKLRAWDTSVMSKISLRMKQILSIYVGGVWAWCLYHVLQEPSKNKQDIYVVIVFFIKKILILQLINDMIEY